MTRPSSARPGDYSLYDLTSSALTEEHKRGTPTPNRYRDGLTYHGNNVGMISVDWRPQGPSAQVQLTDMEGVVRIGKTISFTR